MSNRYDFLHGRDWLAGLYGIALGIVLGAVALAIALLVEDELLARSIIEDYYTIVTIFIVFFVPFGISFVCMGFFPSPKC